MYRAAPYYDCSSSDIQLPKTMYTLTNIHSTTTVDGEDTALLELEQRQERILSELNTLKNEVEILSARYPPISLSPGTSTSTSRSLEKAVADCNWLKTGVVHDIVINANPNQPPHSLFVLYKLLNEQYTCTTAVHVHSSINFLPEQLLDCFVGNCQKDRNQAQLMITLIWKDVPKVEMVINPNSQTPIQGEGNIARYLARLLNPAYDSGDIIRATEIDQWVDLASNSFISGSSRERTSAIKTLNSHLGKQDWLMGGDVSLADILMWSVLHQSGQEVQSAPNNIQKWFKACGIHPAFNQAQGLL